jgi:hypothetical protein
MTSEEFRGEIITFFRCEVCVALPRGGYIVITVAGRLHQVHRVPDL